MELEYFKKICQETGCEIEVFLCEKIKRFDGICDTIEYFEESKIYEDIGKEFNAKIIYNDMNEFNKKTKEYINSDVIILADINSEIDITYFFLLEHKDSKNVICISTNQYIDKLIHNKFPDFAASVSINYNKGLIFELNHEEHQKLICKIKQ